MRAWELGANVEAYRERRGRAVRKSSAGGRARRRCKIARMRRSIGAMCCRVWCITSSMGVLLCASVLVLPYSSGVPSTKHGDGASVGWDGVTAAADAHSRILEGCSDWRKG